MNDYLNEDADIFNEEKPKKGFTIKKLFKFIGVSIIILIYAVLFARCMMTSDSKIVKEVLQDETFIQSYKENPDAFSVRQYAMKSAWVAIRDNRLLEFNYLYYVPLAKQMQFSVKFNTDLPEFDYTEEIPFKFKLVDTDGNEYTDYHYKYDEKFGYGFIRLCFDGIDLETGKTDDDGNKLRNTYKLYIDMVNKDGTYSSLCDYQVYDGSNVYKNISFKVK